jgi:hypothetical protein
VQSLHRGFTVQAQQKQLSPVPVVPHVSRHHHADEMVGVACGAQQHLLLRTRQPGEVKRWSGGSGV